MEIKWFLYSHSIVLQREIITAAGTAYAHLFYPSVSAEIQESSHLEELISQQCLCEEMVIWLCNQIAMCSVSRCEQIKRKPNLDFFANCSFICLLVFEDSLWFFLICLVVVTCSMVLHTFRLQHCGLPTDGMMHFHYSVSLQQDDCLPVNLWNKPKTPP